MTGGPVPSSRMIRSSEHDVTFWARSRDRRNKSRPFTLKGHEFVRRWAMHILPKGFTKTRQYGGYHTAKRADYLERCRALLPQGEAVDESPSVGEPFDADAPGRRCVHCGHEMTLLVDEPRPSWKQVFAVRVYETPDTYCPLLHLTHGATSRGPPEPTGSSLTR